MLAIVVAGCGDSSEGDSDSGGSAGDGDGDGTGAATNATTAADGADGSSGQGGTGSGDGGPFSGDCSANVPLAVADGVELTAMSAEAVRQVDETSSVPLYIVQIHGSDEGANRLDVLFRGDPVLGTTYMPTSPPGTGPGPSFVGLYPQNVTDAHDFVSGTLQFSEAGTEDGELLAASFDLTFEGGTVSGCFALPISVMFVAPP